MNIEEQIKIVKNMLLHAETQLLDYEAIAIETLLTAYEKEKELLELASNMLDNIDYDQIPIEIGELKSELEKEKKKNKELESDIQQKNFEIKCLNSDIKNMYCEEGVIAILEDNFDLSREEAIQILEEE